MKAHEIVYPIFRDYLQGVEIQLDSQESVLVDNILFY